MSIPLDNTLGKKNVKQEKSEEAKKKTTLQWQNSADAELDIT